MRIGIVGAGVSGLTAAYLLDAEHEVTLFEAGEHLGGHVRTLDVDTAGQRLAVDAGFIVFNRVNYPLFSRLLARLEVESQPSEMSFSMQDERTGFEWSGRSPAAVFAWRRNLLRPSFYRMLGEVVRWNSVARDFSLHGEGEVTLGEFLSAHRFSSEFIDRLIVPMGAALWSAEPRSILDFPALAFTRFMANHGLLNLLHRREWRTISGGAARYVEALAGRLRGRVRLGAAITAVTRHADAVEVAVGSGDRETFDLVIVATHSDQALRLLADPSPAEKEILGAIRYQENSVILHTDPQVMPRRRRVWASWNAFMPARPRDRVTVTYHMNRLQQLPTATPVLVTLNREEAIAPDKIVRRFTMAHPIYTRSVFMAQGRWAEINGVNRTYYCGAYWGSGFHEDGVRSAVTVCRHLGQDLL
jgi:predicted NAD/FAD-binding protein